MEEIMLNTVVMLVWLISVDGDVKTGHRFIFDWTVCQSYRIEALMNFADDAKCVVVSHTYYVAS